MRLAFCATVISRSTSQILMREASERLIRDLLGDSWSKEISDKEEVGQESFSQFEKEMSVMGKIIWCHCLMARDGKKGNRPEVIADDVILRVVVCVIAFGG